MNLRFLAAGAFAVGIALSAAIAGSAPPEGASLLGRPSPDWPDLPWVQGGPLRLSGLRGKVVLVRFFTGRDCPYCSATAPSLSALAEEFGPKGLVVIGIYTPKPAPRRTSVAEVRRVAQAYGFRFPVAVDADWRALRRLWLDRVPGASFTSASLLLDRRGVVRHVHPGGVFSMDSSDPKARRDYEALRAAIAALVEEPGPGSAAGAYNGAPRERRKRGGGRDGRGERRWNASRAGRPSPRSGSTSVRSASSTTATSTPTR